MNGIMRDFHPNRPTGVENTARNPFTYIQK